MDNEEIYLDYAATTPLDKEVYSAMEPYLRTHFGNPSSQHTPGRKAQQGVDSARNTIAETLECDRKEIIFTASATESIHLALRGVFENTSNKDSHLVTTTIEHKAVLECARFLEHNGLAVSYLTPDSNGIIGLQHVIDAITPHTKLISIGYINNEIGTIQSIQKIASYIRQNHPHILLHTDATQAPCYFDIRPHTLGVHMMTLSAHKMYGPKGVGLLYKQNDIPLTPLLYGGHQERGYRASTENVAGVVGCAIALKNAQENWQQQSNTTQPLQQQLIESLLDIKTLSLNGSRDNRTPNNVNISIQNIRADVILPYLDQHNIYASSGSACISNTIEPSYVIRAINPQQDGLHSIRITLGKYTTQQHIQKTIHAISTFLHNQTS